MDVNEAILKYYKKLLGSQLEQRESIKEVVINMGHMMNKSHLHILNSPYTENEVKKSLFGILGDILDPIFIETLGQLGDEVTQTVLDFFSIQVNCLRNLMLPCILTLIPKVPCPN